MTQHDGDRLTAQQDLVSDALWTEVVQTVRTFRRGIDQLAEEGDLPYDLAGFPCARCGITSTILGYYLSIRYGLEIEQVSADRDEKKHAWLEVGGLAIDITGDQFEGRPSVFFGERDAWLEAWNEDLRGPPMLAEGQATYSGEVDALQRIIQRSGLLMIDR